MAVAPSCRASLAAAASGLRRRAARSARSGAALLGIAVAWSCACLPATPSSRSPAGVFVPLSLPALPRPRLRTAAAAEGRTRSLTKEERQAQAAEGLEELKRLAAEGQSQEAEDLVYALIDTGLPVSTEHYNAMIQSCLPCQDGKRAERWFFRMQALEVPVDISTYNMLMEMAAGDGSVLDAKHWFQEAKAKSIEPDADSYKAVLRAFRMAKDAPGLEAWLETTLQSGVPASLPLLAEVIGLYCDKLNFRKIEEWLQITERNLDLPLNTEVLNMVLEAYLKAEDLDGANRLYAEMLDMGLKPNAETYRLLIGDGTTRRDAESVKKHCADLVSSGLPIDTGLYESIVGAWAGVQNVQEAQRWFDEMDEHGGQTAKALAIVIDALVLTGGANGLQAAEDLLEDSRELGVEITPTVYAALASADVLSGDFEQVEARLQQMEVEGLEMNEDALAALLLSYANSRPQQGKLAEQMFKQHMLLGKIRASEHVVDALRAAVGGARCLALRRELKLAQRVEDQQRFGHEKNSYLNEDGVMVKPHRVWKHLRTEKKLERPKQLLWE